MTMPVQFDPTAILAAQGGPAGSIAMLTQLGQGYDPIAALPISSIPWAFQNTLFSRLAPPGTPYSAAAAGLLSRPLQEFIRGSGMYASGLGHDQNLYDVIRNRQMQEMQFAAFRAAQTQDRDSILRTITGLARIAGTPMGAEQRAAADRLVQMIQMAGPAMGPLLPVLFDQMAGDRGSAFMLFSQLNNLSRYRLDPVSGQLGYSPRSIEIESQELFRALYDRPQARVLTQAFRAGQLGDLALQLQARGMLAGAAAQTGSDSLQPGLAARRSEVLRALGQLRDDPAQAEVLARLVRNVSPGQPDRDITALSGEQLDRLASDPSIEARLRSFDRQRIERSLTRYVETVSAMRDIFGANGMPNAPMVRLLQGLEALTAGSMAQLQPQQLSQMVRQTHNLAQLTGVTLDRALIVQQHAVQRAQSLGLESVHGVQAMQGALAFGGAYRAQGHSAYSAWGAMNADQLMQLDTNLRVQASGSQLANRLGAIIRLGEQVGGFANDSNLGRLVNAVQGGLTTWRDTTGRERSVNLTDDELLPMLAQATNRAGQSVRLSENDWFTRLQQESENREMVARHQLGNLVRHVQGREELFPFITQIAGSTLQQQFFQLLTEQLPPERRLSNEQAAQLAEQASQRIQERVVQRSLRLSTAEFSDSRTREQAIGRIIQQELAGTELAPLLQSMNTAQQRQWLHLTAGQIYGQVNQAIRNSTYSAFGNLQNVHRLFNPQVLAQEQALRMRASLEAQFQEALAPLGRGTMMSRVAEAIARTNPSDATGMRRQLALALGGIENQEIVEQLLPQVQQLQQLQQQAQQYQARMANAQTPTERSQVYQEASQHMIQLQQASQRIQNILRPFTDDANTSQTLRELQRDQQIVQRQSQQLQGLLVTERTPSTAQLQQVRDNLGLAGGPLQRLSQEEAQAAVVGARLAQIERLAELTDAQAPALNASEADHRNYRNRLLGEDINDLMQRNQSLSDPRRRLQDNQWLFRYAEIVRQIQQRPSPTGQLLTARQIREQALAQLRAEAQNLQDEQVQRRVQQLSSENPFFSEGQYGNDEITALLQYRQRHGAQTPSPEQVQAIYQQYGNGIDQAQAVELAVLRQRAVYQGLQLFRPDQPLAMIQIAQNSNVVSGRDNPLAFALERQFGRAVAMEMVASGDQAAREQGQAYLNFIDRGVNATAQNPILTSEDNITQLRGFYSYFDRQMKRMFNSPGGWVVERQLLQEALRRRTDQLWDVSEDDRQNFLRTHRQQLRSRDDQELTIANMRLREEDVRRFRQTPVGQRFAQTSPQSLEFRRHLLDFLIREERQATSANRYREFLTSEEGQGYQQQVQQQRRQYQQLVTQLLDRPSMQRMGLYAIDSALQLRSVNEQLEQLASTYAGGDLAALLAGQFNPQVAEISVHTEEGRQRRLEVLQQVQQAQEQLRLLLSQTNQRMVMPTTSDRFNSREVQRNYTQQLQRSLQRYLTNAADLTDEERHFWGVEQQLGSLPQDQRQARGQLVVRRLAGQMSHSAHLQQLSMVWQQLTNPANIDQMIGYRQGRPGADASANDRLDYQMRYTALRHGLGKRESLLGMLDALIAQRPQELGEVTAENRQAWLERLGRAVSIDDTEAVVTDIVGQQNWNLMSNNGRPFWLQLLHHAARPNAPSAEDSARQIAVRLFASQLNTQDPNTRRVLQGMGLAENAPQEAVENQLIALEREARNAPNAFSQRNADVQQMVNQFRQYMQVMQMGISDPLLLELQAAQLQRIPIPVAVLQGVAAGQNQQLARSVAARMLRLPEQARRLTDEEQQRLARIDAGDVRAFNLSEAEWRTVLGLPANSLSEAQLQRLNAARSNIPQYTPQQLLERFGRERATLSPTSGLGEALVRTAREGLSSEAGMLTLFAAAGASRLDRNLLDQLPIPLRNRIRAMQSAGEQNAALRRLQRGMTRAEAVQLLGYDPDTDPEDTTGQQLLEQMQRGFFHINRSQLALYESQEIALRAAQRQGGLLATESLRELLGPLAQNVDLNDATLRQRIATGFGSEAAVMAALRLTPEQLQGDSDEAVRRRRLVAALRAGLHNIGDRAVRQFLDDELGLSYAGAADSTSSAAIALRHAVVFGASDPMALRFAGMALSGSATPSNELLNFLRLGATPNEAALRRQLGLPEFELNAQQARLLAAAQRGAGLEELARIRSDVTADNLTASQRQQVDQLRHERSQENYIRQLAGITHTRPQLEGIDQLRSIAARQGVTSDEFIQTLVRAIPAAADPTVAAELSQRLREEREPLDEAEARQLLRLDATAPLTALQQQAVLALRSGGVRSNAFLQQLRGAPEQALTSAQRYGLLYGAGSEAAIRGELNLEADNLTASQRQQVDAARRMLRESGVAQARRAFLRQLGLPENGVLTAAQEAQLTQLETDLEQLRDFTQRNPNAMQQLGVYHQGTESIRQYREIFQTSNAVLDVVAASFLENRGQITPEAMQAIAAQAINVLPNEEAAVETARRQYGQIRQQLEDVQSRLADATPQQRPELLAQHAQLVSQLQGVASNPTIAAVAAREGATGIEVLEGQRNALRFTQLSAEEQRVLETNAQPYLAAREELTVSQQRLQELQAQLATIRQGPIPTAPAQARERQEQENALREAIARMEQSVQDAQERMFENLRPIQAIAQERGVLPTQLVDTERPLGFVDPGQIEALQQHQQQRRGAMRQLQTMVGAGPVGAAQLSAILATHQRVQDFARQMVEQQRPPTPEALAQNLRAQATALGGTSGGVLAAVPDNLLEQITRGDETALQRGQQLLGHMTQFNQAIQRLTTDGQSVIVNAQGRPITDQREAADRLLHLIRQSNTGPEEQRAAARNALQAMGNRAGSLVNWEQLMQAGQQLSQLLPGATPGVNPWQRFFEGVQPGSPQRPGEPGGSPNSLGTQQNPMHIQGQLQGQLEITGNVANLTAIAGSSREFLTPV